MRIAQQDNDRLPCGDRAAWLYVTHRLVAIKLPKHRHSFSGQDCQAQRPPGYPGFRRRFC